MPSPRNCDRCQRPLDGVALGVLCPVCLAALARAPWFDPEAHSSTTTEPAHGASSSPPAVAPEGLPFELRDKSRPIGHFGDYELLEEIARGGMGVIYRARQISLDRLVAIKMIRAGVLASELDIVRFHAEARAAAGLRHPSIVAIHEVGEVEDRHYFSMEFVAGRNLAACVRERPWSGIRAARCLRTVAVAVDYAHHQGILHRDLKPSNVIIDEAGEPHLTDFGLATQIEGASALTLSGVILGTPSYMAPEQTGGRRTEIGPRTDVYALGAILYEVLTGRPPFQGESPLNTIQLVRDTEAVPLRRLNPRIPADLETLCLKCLEKDPRRRYSTAQDLADDLGRFLNDEPIRARPARAWEHGWKWVRRNPWRAALAAASVVILLGTLVLAFQVLKNRELESEVAARKEMQREAEKARSDAENAARLEAKERLVAQSARREAEAAAERERESREDAEEARDQERLSNYLRSILLARQAWEANNLLESHRILSNCPAEFRHWEWYYLARLNRPDLRETPLFAAATHGINPATWVQGGNRIAAMFDQSATQVVDLKSGTVAPLPKIPGQHLKPLALAARNPWIAVVVGAGEKGRLTMVHPANTNRVQEFEDSPALHCALAFADEDRVLVSASDDGLVAWDTTKGHKRWQMGGPVSEAGIGFVVSPDTRLLAWSTTDSVAWINASGQQLKSAGETVQVLEATTGRVLATMPPRDEAIHAAAFGPESKMLATGYEGGWVRIYNLPDGVQVRSFRHDFGTIECLVFSTDGQVLITGSSDGAVRVERLAPREAADVHVYRGHRGSVRALLPDASSPMFLSVGADASIRRWRLDEPQEGMRLSALGKSLDFVGDRYVIAGGGQVGGEHVVYDVVTGESHARAAPRPGGRLAAASDEGYWTDAGEYYAASTFEKTIDLNSKWSAGKHYGVSLEATGKFLATTGPDNSVVVWDIAMRTRLQSFQATTNAGWSIHSLAFSPDGKLVAAAVGSVGNPNLDRGGQGEVRVWEWSTRRLKVTLRARRFAVWDVKFSHDGTRLASAGGNFGWLYPGLGRVSMMERQGEIQVWNLMSGDELFDLPGVPDNVLSIDFSPDDRRLLAAVGKHKGRGLPPGEVKIWEMKAGQETFSLRGFPGPVTGVAFSPNGQRIAAVGSGVLRIFDAGVPLPGP